MTYENILINSLRYFGLTDMREIERMTPYEYSIRITAYQLSELDKEYHIYLQAWQNRQIQANKKVGSKEKAYFESFDQFFDYKKKENAIIGKSSNKVTDELRDKVFRANL